MLFQHGKAILDASELELLAKELGYKDIRPIEKHLKKLQKLGWIRLNEATGYFYFKAFNKIYIRDNKQSRVGATCYIDDLKNIYAFIGAALYTYLYRDFKTRVTREKVVRLMGRTFHSFSPSFDKEKPFYPVATTGIKALYGISITKASLLKTQAEKVGYIEVKKDYEVTEYYKSTLHVAQKHHPKGDKLFVRGGRLCLQLIDLVLPSFALRKRHKLKTYTGLLGSKSSYDNKHFSYKLNKS